MDVNKIFCIKFYVTKKCAPACKHGLPFVRTSCKGDMLPRILKCLNFTIGPQSTHHKERLS